MRDLGPDEAEARRTDLAASYQRAIVDALVERTGAALERESIDRVAIGGGVAANSELRERMAALCAQRAARLWAPELSLCTDNAAMIAGAARFIDPLPYPEYLDLDASARLG
jgi:N6-L-threonylcarbamoyladenine synthase